MTDTKGRENPDFPGNSVVFAPDSSEIHEDAVRPVRRIAAIHDLSCFGRCALTVVIPTLSAMGNQVVPIPTALLSTHTGGFEGLHFCDLSDSIMPIFEHFEALGLKFDAIYTGFLGSEKQIDMVEHFISRFSDEKTLVMVDPVMGDDGVLYATYTKPMMQGIAKLCRRANIITPNLTEACFLTGIPYRNTANMTEEERSEYICNVSVALEQVSGADRVVVTGIFHGTDALAVSGTDRKKKETVTVTTPRVKKNYPGTGDLYASVLLGSLLRGEDFGESIRYAADFTRDVMAFSAEYDTPARDGVALEAFLPRLFQPRSGDKGTEENKRK